VTEIDSPILKIAILDRSATVRQSGVSINASLDQDDSIMMLHQDAKRAFGLPARPLRVAMLIIVQLDTSDDFWL
jgi:hypothetical protein